MIAVFFVVLTLILGAAVALVFASGRWQSATKAAHISLEAARRADRPHRFDVRELAGLPEPVKQYFQTVLTVGQPIVATVRLEQTGTMKVRPAQAQGWRPFTAVQRVVTNRPGFDWDARIALAPGIPIRVRDAYIAGEGMLKASLFGLLTVAHLQDKQELARDELMRFVAEAPLYPTALLPSQGVHWEGAGPRQAWATICDGPHTVGLLFAFTEQGVVASVRAPERGRTVGQERVPTPWVGYWREYRNQDGMLIPGAGEVGWQLQEGEALYWRGQNRAVHYSFAPVSAPPTL
ncbi:MAG: DUF6920 family protein [Thermodesulfobacteriota bacterium]